jgi:hypothetical protein
MVLTNDAYNETLESEKGKEDKLTSIEKQLNLMQSQFQMLISTHGNVNRNEIERNSMAKTLRLGTYQRSYRNRTAMASTIIIRTFMTAKPRT